MQARLQARVVCLHGANTVCVCVLAPCTRWWGAQSRGDGGGVGGAPSAPGTDLFRHIHLMRGEQKDLARVQPHELCLLPVLPLVVQLRTRHQPAFNLKGSTCTRRVGLFDFFVVPKVVE